MLRKKLEDRSSKISLKNNDTQSKKKPITIYDTLIIGAGFSGAFTAEQACDTNPQSKIALFDKDGLLSPVSSSQNECFKMHTGLHYISDRITAETCLRHSVEMADAFYEFILDKDDAKAPSRRGRHYIMSNSHSEDYVKAECENLKKLYEELIQDFPNAIKVFGEPENFIKYLNPEEYPYVSPCISFTNEKNQTEPIHVSLAIETPECQIDINQFRDYFNKVFVYRRKQLSLFYGHTVTRIQHAPDFLGYSVETRRFEQSANRWVTETILTKAIVNCTWQNIDNIDSYLNFNHNDRVPSTIRAKAITTVTVPSSLVKSLNTCIFSQGPHVSLTRLPDEKLIVTYEPETNIGHFPSGTPFHRLESGLLKNLLTPITADNIITRQVELHKIGERILEGAIKYVPLLQEASILSTAIGFVKVFSETETGNQYLYDPESPIRRRREDGIQERSLCYISFSGMKMTYSFKAAKKVVETLQEQLLISDELDDIIKEIIILIAQEKGAKYYIIRPALNYSLKEYLLSKLQTIFLPKNDLTYLQSTLKNWRKVINIYNIARQYSEHWERRISEDEITLECLIKDKIHAVFNEIISNIEPMDNKEILYDIYHSLHCSLKEYINENTNIILEENLIDTWTDIVKVNILNSIRVINETFSQIINSQSLEVNAKTYEEISSSLYNSLKKHVAKNEPQKSFSGTRLEHAISTLEVWRTEVDIHRIIEDCSLSAEKNYSSLKLN